MARWWLTLDIVTLYRHSDSLETYWLFGDMLARWRLVALRTRGGSLKKKYGSTEILWPFGDVVVHRYTYCTGSWREAKSIICKGKIVSV